MHIQAESDTHSNGDMQDSNYHEDEIRHEKEKLERRIESLKTELKHLRHTYYEGSVRQEEVEVENTNLKKITIKMLNFVI